MADTIDKEIRGFFRHKYKAKTTATAIIKPLKVISNAALLANASLLIENAKNAKIILISIYT